VNSVLHLLAWPSNLSGPAESLRVVESTGNGWRRTWTSRYQRLLDRRQPPHRQLQRDPPRPSSRRHPRALRQQRR